MTGYPSIDRPWKKYYSEEVLHLQIPSMSMYELLVDSNKDRLNMTAMVYYGNSITYGDMLSEIKKVIFAFVNLGIKKGDIVTVISLNTPETVYSMYGLNAIGAIINLVNANDKASEVEENIITTKSKAVIILDKIMEKIGRLNINVPIIMLSVGSSANGIVKILAGDKKHKDSISYKSFINSGTDLNLSLENVNRT